MEEYTGKLPKNIYAQLQEHTAGGFLLFRISSEGDVVIDLSFDDEQSYLAILTKASTMIKTLAKVEDMKMLNTLSMESANVLEDDEEFADDEDEEDEYEEEDDGSTID